MPTRYRLHRNPECKYLANAFDGKVLWLLVGEEEIRAKFQHGEEPPVEQYEKDFGSFKTSSYGHNRTWDAEKVNVTPERTQEHLPHQQIQMKVIRMLGI